MEFRQAHIRRQRQLQASGGGEPLGRAHAVLPAPAGTINRLGTAFDNLALAAANDTTVLQQLTAANSTLTALNAFLTAANRKLWRSSRQPSRSLLERLSRRTNHFLKITVGLTAIVSARLTRVPHAATRPRVTRTRRRRPTQRVVERRTRDGTHVAPDGVGWRM